MALRRVAFFGLGNMGAPMARNLARAGHRVVAFDPRPREAVDCPPDVTMADHPEAAIEGADAVVSMLPHGAAVSSLYLGDSGLLAKLSSSTTVLDCSTIDASTARSVGEAAKARGIGFMDTPVSGGTAVAAAGNLAFMCGGEASTFERAKPILTPMGPKIFHAGPLGAGQVAKACNNMLLAVHMIGTCEALEMGARHGLSPEKLSEVLLASSGRNWSLEIYNPYPGVMENAPASKGYAPGFQSDLMVKDLGLAMETADQVGFQSSMGALAKQLYTEHQGAGFGGRDFSSILQLLQERSSAPSAGK